MFARELHPSLYDSIERKLTRSHIRLRPRESVPHPADMQFLVKERAGRAATTIEEGLSTLRSKASANDTPAGAQRRPRAADGGTLPRGRRRPAGR